MTRVRAPRGPVSEELATPIHERAPRHRLRVRRAAHGDMTPGEAIAGFDFLLAVLPPVAVPAVCGFAGRWCTLLGTTSTGSPVTPSPTTRRRSSPFFGGQLLMFQGLVAASRGEPDAGLASFTEGRTRFQAVGGRSGAASYQALLAPCRRRSPEHIGSPHAGHTVRPF